MKYLLEAPQIDRLCAFAMEHSPLLAFAFDGTLAPIVDRPEAARMRPSTASYLADVALAHPTIVLSGRRRADVVPRLGGAAVIAVIGNHGAEPSPEMARLARDVRGWIPQLATLVRTFDGVEIEDKTYSLAVHFRHARTPEVAFEAIQFAVLGLIPTPRLVVGQCVVNVLSRDAPHKGAALARVLRDTDVGGVIYVGDDVTDEDPFEMGDPARPVLCVHIGPSTTSPAQFYLKAQTEIDTLLDLLLHVPRARPPSALDVAGSDKGGTPSP